jgi:predicted ATPase/class 3 adenylate cyclase
VAAPHPTRTDPPAGTVTLLFADVEGSTRLLHTLGERFAPARTRLREVVREGVAGGAGHEVDWAGDGVFLAFASARDAVSAAVEIQRRLAQEPWDPDAALRLRMGIHTGEPELVDGGYVGLDVVLAARICASAHGEQVVVSQATRDMVGDEPVSGGSYRPLGRHRLKDLPGVEHLYQVVASGLRTDFPPLRTLSASGLPILHHRLVGRADAVARMRHLLSRPEVRLVTITGPGGAGKSRIALEVAAEAALERPVHLVALAPVSEPDLVPAAIASAIGVRETPGRPLMEVVAEELHGTGALLFLDNLEHLAPAATHVAALLAHAPDVDVLATSRVALHLLGEHVLPLDPLQADDAATLFVELAAARGVVLREDALASVHEICRRLDGLPLAIELVAARLVVLPPQEILRALDDGLALELEGPVDLPERQRTLRATIDWSYRLLSDPQRALHAALAVFVGGAALDDARTVAGSDGRFLSDLEALVAWSLVRSEVADGHVRLSMLETVREHALERAGQTGMLATLRNGHAELFLGLAREAEPGLAGEDQTEWLARLEREHDNLGAAVDWLFLSGRVEEGLSAVSALERFWRAHGHVSEARRLLALGLGLASDVAPDVRASALWTAAQQATAQSDWPAAATMLDDARLLFHELGRGREEIFALANGSFVARMQGDVARAEALADEAVARARELGDDRATSGALMALGDVHSDKRDHDGALARYEEAILLRSALGDPLLVADAVLNAGMAEFRAGYDTRSRVSFERALELARRLDEKPYVAASQLMLALLDLRDGDGGVAGERAGESLALYVELGDDRSSARCVLVLAGAAAVGGDDDEALSLAEQAAELRRGEPPDEFEQPVLDRQLAQLSGTELAERSLPSYDRRTSDREDGS